MKTFGCKVNWCDSRDLAQRLAGAGCVIAGPGESGADAFLVNTCAVTDRAVKKCAKFLRGLHRDRPGMPVAVFGCASSFGEGLPPLDGQAFFPRGAEREAVAFLLERLGIPGSENGESPNRESGIGADLGASPSPIPHSPSPERGQEENLGKTRAFLKIADGCDARCTYCVVPALRGPFRSRSPDKVLAEAEELARAGHREIVLTAIHLGKYGADLDSPLALGDLVRRIAEKPAVSRVRLSSVEAMELDEKLLSLADEPAFAPHFHLPLQSGNGEILCRMGRTYTPAAFLEAVEAVRTRFSLPGLSTDIIVGFPGETEQAFEDTLVLCGKARFTRIHAFPFSPRKSTPAFEFTNRPDPGTVRRRMKALLEEARRLAEAFRASKIGTKDSVLAEKPAEGREGWLEGFDGSYQRVAFRGELADLGALVPVRITATDGEVCLGEKIQP
ncbi:MAG: MiaB/RimO family radical SAM methylthiotransferase [Planctomycetota bacterium]